jgi:hypothetical protein
MKKLTAFKVIGFLVFLCSVILPFMSANSLGGRGNFDSVHQSQFWSFRSFTEHSLYNVIFGTEDYWFYDYWFKLHVSGLELLFMFVVEILTLFTSLASIFIKKRNFALAPVVLCLMVIALMVYVGEIGPIQRTMPPYTYQLGFWLTFPSLFVFLAVFILERRQERNANVHKLPKNADTIPNTKEAQ